MREWAQAAVEATPGATRVPGWQVRSSASTGDGGAAISTPGYAADSWLRVSARSTVLAGLVENGVYPDLFVGTNLRDAVDATDFAVPWWYRADLTIAAHSGLTTLLDVAGVISRGNLWINGHELATSRELAGAWTTHTFDITRLVRPGANSIAGDVRFQETVRLSARERAPVTFTPAGAPQLTFREPRIWWPHDLGEQPLYDLDLRAAAGGVESDGARTTFGIRDVRSSLTGDGH